MEFGSHAYESFHSNYGHTLPPQLQPAKILTYIYTKNMIKTVRTTLVSNHSRLNEIILVYSCNEILYTSKNK